MISKKRQIARSERDEKINIRLPKSLKASLEKRAKQAGYSKLSPYVLELLIDHVTESNSKAK